MFYDNFAAYYFNLFEKSSITCLNFTQIEKGILIFNP
jgi:hypothetical protein